MPTQTNLDIGGGVDASEHIYEVLNIQRRGKILECWCWQPQQQESYLYICFFAIKTPGDEVRLWVSIKIIRTLMHVGCPCKAPGTRFTNGISCFVPGSQEPYMDLGLTSQWGRGPICPPPKI
jgi:hypothetical protein